MGLRLVIFHLFTAIVAANLIFAQPSSPRESFGVPIFGNDNSNESEPSFGPDPSGSGPQIPPRPDFNVPGFGSQQEQSADAEEDEQEPRLFFASTVSCNYTTQGGSLCSGCRQVLACYPNNVGRLRTCRGLARYCNSGRCSIVPGSECSG